ncbi:MAG: ABC transporter ATP-binding protein [Calditrichia bacterium]
MHIKAKNIFKEFDDKVIIENISCDARSGHILGILGSDGSGKTTVLRMLMNIVQPTEGEITFDDLPITKAVRNTIGYMPEERGLRENESIYRILAFQARLKNLSRKRAHVETIRLIDRFKLIDQMDAPISTLPDDMREKLHIMSTIIHNPDILILDEPFKNVSESNCTLVSKMLMRFRDEGKTIVIASEDLNEAEKLCDEVVLLNDGQTVLQGAVVTILERFQENLVIVEGRDNLQSLRNIQGVKKFSLNRQTAKMFVDKRIPTQKILEVITKLVDVTRIEVNHPNLNDIFLEIVRGKPQGE